MLSILWTPRAGNLQRIKFQDFCQDRAASNELVGWSQNVLPTTLKPNGDPPDLWHPSMAGSSALEETLSTDQT